MSILSPERWRALEPLLDRALELEDGARQAWLGELRALRPDTAADLESLLASREEISRERFLADALPPPEPLPSSLAGQTIGAYTLLEPIGQGGMGSVWLAQRSDGRFEGRMAVKLLNASLVGRAGEARFRREGSILARLTHPNIAHLVDAGVSPSGQPYIVLEHVDGEPVDRYCDAHRLGIGARLRLFLDVCAAVARAHGNLVVHRDIKPSNVLVAREGQVKLLDFGIAKLLEEETAEAEASALTREGGRALTPEYAAPEQLTGGAVTTATDVWALGTLLYILLTGQHPAAPPGSNPALLLKAIVEIDPRRPSDTVTDEAAQTRGSTLEGLRRQLRGDLDTILAKALKKIPSERYPSVEALAADLRHQLADEPIAARPDTFRYRTGKFVRRHRAGVLAGLIAAAAALIGSAAIVWQAREARRQRDEARAQVLRADAVKDFLGFLLSAAAASGRQYSAAELLDQGEVMIDRQFAGDNRLRAEMLTVVGRQHMIAERFDKAVEVLRRAGALAKEVGDPAPTALAQSLLALASLAAGGETRDAEETIGRALADLPNEPRFTSVRAECLAQKAAFGFITEDGGSMIRDASESLRLLDASGVPNPSLRFDAQSSLAFAYYLTRQNAKAERAYAEVLSALERAGRGRTTLAADNWNNWALVHFSGDIRKAEPLMRRCLELRRSFEGAAIAPSTLFNYAGLLQRLGRFEEAERVFQESIRISEVRKNVRNQVDAMLELTDTYTESGDLPAAQKELDGVSELAKELPRSALTEALLTYSRGFLAMGRGERGRARDELAASVRLFETAQARAAQTVFANVELARAETALGNWDAAEARSRAALALADSLVEKDSPSYLRGHALAALGEAQLARGDLTGEKTLRSALGELEATLGPAHAAPARVRRLVENASNRPR